MRIIGVVNEPVAVEMPAELAALSVALDEALEQYDDNLQTWQLADHRQHASSSEPTPATAADLEDAHAGLVVAEKRLKTARDLYNAAQQTITAQRVAAEYAADQRQQAEQRLARQEAALARIRKRGLRALAAKVTGA